MKKIKEDRECFGLGVKFRKGIELKQDEGSITSIFMASRNTSVPMIVVASDSEAKKQGQDGIFVICCDKCGIKMKKTLKDEINLFHSIGEMTDLK